MKIGILTKYYLSSNYGGLLQAYALCRYLNNYGLNAEQICYDINTGIENGKAAQRFKNATILEKIIKIKNRISSYTINILSSVVLRDVIDRRNDATKRFREEIPHSEKVYCETTLNEINDKYDAVIVGSDRVWWPVGIADSFYLPNISIHKAAYAASAAYNQLTDEDGAVLRYFFEDFDCISVREESMISIIQPFYSKPIQWVLDPTFLLSRSEWDLIIPDRRNTKGYVFCYFLGDDVQNRNVAYKYAKNRKLEIVNVNFAKGQLNISDIFFGDRKVENLTPPEFVSYIKYADAIFTDSFHATVFSIIYKKNVYALERGEMQQSGTRLQSLTKLFGIEARYCAGEKKRNYNYINGLSPIEFSEIEEKLSSLREASINFLDNFIEEVKR